MRNKLWSEKWLRGQSLSDEGGHGRTWYASRAGEDVNKPTAVLKELKRQNDPNRRARMAREVASLKLLNHKAIAKCLDSNADCVDADDELYLVTELIEGCTLADFVGGLPQPLSTALDVTTQLVDVIEYCHGLKVLHRDIKPENAILRNRDPKQVVLIDFGLSFNDDGDMDGFQTRDSEPIGSRFLQLPEFSVPGANKRDIRSDIVQLVGILFYMLTGGPPSVLVDSGGKKPHERAALPAIGDHQAQLRRIFDIGFEPNLSRRWQSLPSLRHELVALRTPSPSIVLFSDRLDLIGKELLEEPEYKAVERFEEVSQTLNREFNRLFHEAAQKLSQVVQFVAGQPFVQVPGTKLVGSLQFKRKHADYNTLVPVQMLLRRDAGEFFLVGRVRQSTVDIARAGIFDPEIVQIFSSYTERFLAESLERELRAS